MTRFAALLTLAAGVAFGQATPFYNPQPYTNYNFQGAFAPGPNPIPFQVLTPQVGTIAECGTPQNPIRLVYISVQAYDNCYYTNYANMNAGYTQGPNDNALYSAGYQQVYNPDYPLYLMADWTYEVNCDSYPIVITTYEDDYGCPPNTP